MKNLVVWIVLILVVALAWTQLRPKPRETLTPDESSLYAIRNFSNGRVLYQATKDQIMASHGAPVVVEYGVRGNVKWVAIMIPSVGQYPVFVGKAPVSGKLEALQLFGNVNLLSKGHAAWKDYMIRYKN